jgi:hypothetical protein
VSIGKKKKELRGQLLGNGTKNGNEKAIGSFVARPLPL